MFNLLPKLFIKNYSNTADAGVRQQYGFLSGILGIICNLLLFALKLTVGLLIGSVAVITDAFNNLSDMGSTVVSLIGIRLSNKRPDEDHPFGHGRLEYITALIVSFIIMLVGFELLRTSFNCVINPNEPEKANWLLIALLVLSIPVKLFMFGYNRAFGKKISSQPLLATAQDSLNDCIATLAVIISAIIDGLRILPFAVDGYMGLLVALWIMYAGFGVAKDTVGILLGKAPDEETVNEIVSVLSDTQGVIGIHDLIVHDYGPGRLFASAHVEVDGNDFISAHELIDSAEQRIFEKIGCVITIHLDPISSNNARLEAVRARLKAYIGENMPEIRFHDLRMSEDKDATNIVFDIVVAGGTSERDAESLTDRLAAFIKSIDEGYRAVIHIDEDFR